MIRIGHGFDVHKFGGEGPLTICGEKIDYPQGFLAHSDGDVAIHALCDAILGSLAMRAVGVGGHGWRVVVPVANPVASVALPLWFLSASTPGFVPVLFLSQYS